MSKRSIILILGGLVGTAISNGDWVPALFAAVAFVWDAIDGHGAKA